MLKQILIEKMILHNFKGVTKVVPIDFEGKNVNLVGVNGSGKTTIFDGFVWCLFGKDSVGRADGNKDFELKPKDRITGEAIHNLETTVELTLNVDGQTITLKRVFFEEYKKIRGSEYREFTGHSTNYYVNGVLKLKKDYEKFIKENIIDDEVFKMLTDVKYFSELPWANRRQILLENFGNKTELDVINENPSLAPLKDQLVLGITVDDVIKAQKDEQKRLNKQIDANATEITILQETEYKNLDDDYDNEANTKKLEEQSNRLSGIDGQLATGNNQAQVQEYEKAKFDIEKSRSKLEKEIDDLELIAKSEHNKLVQNEKGKLSELEYSLKRLEDNKLRLEERISNGKKSIKEQEEAKQKLYVEYDKVYDKTFTEGTCSHCGQVLPVEKLEEAKEHFNLHKAQELEDITKKGNEINETIKKYQDAVKGFETELKQVNTDIKSKEHEIEQKSTYLVLLNNEEPKADETKLSELNKQIEKYNDRIAAIDKTIKKLKSQGSNEVLEQAKKELKAEIELLHTKRAEFNIKTQNEKKVLRLREENQVLNQKHEAAQKLILLGEKFRDIFSKSVEADINKQFELVEWKLFHENINKGIENVCVAKYKGTEYPSCSNGEKINIGLDIINALQKVFGVSAPIFIDNAEGVSDWLVESNSQLIKMYVDPDVKVLEIQVEEEE